MIPWAVAIERALVGGAAMLGVAFALWALGIGCARREMRRLLGPAARAWRPVGGRELLRAAALVALVAAAALATRQRAESSRAGAPADVVVLVDVSRSMEARDVPPSRLARARRAASEAIAALGPDDRAALAAFAGRGVLLTPLTADRDALLELIPALESSLLQAPGSALGAGIRAAVGAFREQPHRLRAVVVLSDGEDPSGRLGVGEAAARRARARVLAVAIGSEQGAPVPTAAQGGALKPGARPPVTRVDLDRLGRLARASGGRLVRTDRWGRAAVGRELAELLGRAPAAPPSAPRRSRLPGVRILLLAAFAALLLELGAPGRRVRRGREGSTTAWTLVAAAALGLGAAGATAAQAPSPRARAVAERQLSRHEVFARIRAGLAHARAGRLAAAARAFRAVAEGTQETPVEALARYDLGVTELRRERLHEARAAFLRALELDPTDEQARFNLEWVAQRLREQARAVKAGPTSKRPAGAAGEGASARPVGSGPGLESEGTQPRRQSGASARAPVAREDSPPKSAARRTVAKEPAARPRGRPPLAPELLDRWLAAAREDARRSLRAAVAPGASGPRPAVRGPDW